MRVPLPPQPHLPCLFLATSATTKHEKRGGSGRAEHGGKMLEPKESPRMLFFPCCSHPLSKSRVMLRRKNGVAYPVLSLSQMVEEEEGARLGTRMAGGRRQQKVVFGISTLMPRGSRASLALNQNGTVALGNRSLTLSSNPAVCFAPPFPATVSFLFRNCSRSYSHVSCASLALLASAQKVFFALE